MTISQKPSKKISLNMKSEGHYRKTAEVYRKSQQYSNMKSLYPILQNILNEYSNEKLVE
tara:strand:- start:257 stop:433 length:177 start_codon:yes stop_codon:yes gene_type:complete